MNLGEHNSTHNSAYVFIYGNGVCIHLWLIPVWLLIIFQGPFTFDKFRCFLKTIIVFFLLICESVLCGPLGNSYCIISFKKE